MPTRYTRAYPGPITRLSQLSREAVVKSLNGLDAASHIITYSEARLAGNAAFHQLARFSEARDLRDRVHVEDTGLGFRTLIDKTTGLEAMFDVTGYALELRLPPLPANYKIKDSDDLNYFVRLVAPRCPAFAKAHDALIHIHRLFDEGFAEGNLNEYKGEYVEDWPTIVAKTRMLTRESWNPFEAAPLPDNIDDHGVLARLLDSGKFVHTDDNIVCFEEMVERVPEQTVDAFPGCFRVGQVVNATLSFRTVKVGSRNVMLVHLDRLVLVGRYGCEILDRALIQQPPTAPKSGQIVRKRRLDVQDSIRKRQRGMGPLLSDMLPVGLVEDPVTPWDNDAYEQEHEESVGGELDGNMHDID